MRTFTPFTPVEKSLQSRVKNTLREAGILKYENHDEYLNVTRLRRITDDELRRMRRVGEMTIEAIHELKEKLKDF